MVHNFLCNLLPYSYLHFKTMILHPSSTYLTSNSILLNHPSPPTFSNIFSSTRPPRESSELRCSAEDSCKGEDKNSRWPPASNVCFCTIQIRMDRSAVEWAFGGPSVSPKLSPTTTSKHRPNQLEFQHFSPANRFLASLHMIRTVDSVNQFNAVFAQKTLHFCWQFSTWY